MIKILNFSIEHKNNNNLLADVYFLTNNKRKPIVIFCHGFKGFKDWGAWHLVTEKFAQNNFVFVKFNFLNNGIGNENLDEFTNLEAFKQNTYTKELEDLKKVIDCIQQKKLPIAESEYNENEIYLIGHSRGGGIALTKTAENKHIKKTATWASISTFDRFGSEEDISNWEKLGYKNFPNARTGQDMFIDYSFYEDFIQNKERLNLEKSVSKISVPLLLVHGTADEAVGYSHSLRLKNACKNAELFSIENANHVFGAKHPWQETFLPKDLATVVSKTIDFFTRKSD
jgi:dipeptidyl aminopeptidase/acylaminoacyl peptidase